MPSRTPAPETAPERTYSPLYFLASLGAGGLAVTFFMYLMFWVPHPGQPVPVFEDVAAAFATGTLPLQAAIVVALLGIAWFGYRNIRLLIWNLARMGGFRGSAAGTRLLASNAETQLLAMPLALAMTVNVGFILGLVFVPGLWGVVEYLFPVAMLVFLAIGALAFAQLGRFLGRLMGQGGFNCRANNSFAQLLPAFTLSMVGVGLAAPGAMSTTAVTAGISIVFSTFFLVSAVIIAVIAMTLGIRSMMENGVADEAAPTLMIVVPIVTVLSILLIRQGHGLHVHFDVHGGAGETLVMLTRGLSLQVLFLLLGLMVLARVNYWGRFVFGQGSSAGSYALICPGVALSVLLHFWINKGLAASGMIAKFGVAYWSLTGLAILAQIATIALVVWLDRRHFGRGGAPAEVPAT